MSKNIKRQRKLEDMTGSNSTKKRKGDNVNATNVDKKNVVNNSSKYLH